MHYLHVPFLSEPAARIVEKLQHREIDLFTKTPHCQLSALVQQERTSQDIDLLVLTRSTVLKCPVLSEGFASLHLCFSIAKVSMYGCSE